MSEGTSVGKIFLELDILSDLKSQLEGIAGKAQGQAKSSFENVGKAASEAMQRPVEKMNKTVEKVTDKVQKTVEECITATGESLDAMVERALKPRNFEVKAKVTQTAAEPNAPRGPPKYAMAGPDPAEFIANYGKQAKESAVPMSDIFQAAEKPAELLKQKLENLTAQITDQREALLKLENAYAKLGDEGGKEGDKLAQKITATEGRLISLQQTLLQTQAKYDKAMSGAAQATEKPKEAVASLGEQIKSTLKSAASKGGKSVHAGIGGGVERAKATASKAVDSIKQKTDKLGRSIKSAFKSAIFMAGLYAAFRALRDLVTGALAQNEHFSASLNALKANLQIAFTPILQSVMPMLNALMAGLAKAAKSLAVFMSALTGRTYEQSVAATKKLQSAAQGAKKTAKETAGALAGFDQVNNIEKSEAAQSTEGQNALPVYGDIGENIKVSPNVEKAANKLRTLFEPLQKINLNNLKSALGELKEAAKPITSKLFEGLEWAYYNLFVPLANWVISDALPAFLRVLAGALKVLNSILEALKPLGTWLWENFLKPLAEWTGGVIVSVLGGIADALTRISDWISSHQEVVQGMTVTVAAFFAAWKVVELLSFIQQSGGVVAALKSITTAIAGSTLAKLKDKAETAALNVMYAKDFVVSIAKSTAALAKQAVQWTIETAKKIASTAATWAHQAATLAATAATWLFNTAMTALTSPITLVVAAIGALIAIVVLLVKNWDTVKATAIDVWNKIKEAWNKAGDWFHEHVTEPITGFFTSMWASIKKAFHMAIDWIKKKFTDAVNGWISIVESFINFFIRGLNVLVRGINKLSFDVPDWVPGIGGKSLGFNIPLVPQVQIPRLAQGGIVSQPTLAMVGDNRQSAEAIAPLHELYGMIKQAVADGGTGLTASEIYTAMLNALNDSKFGSQIRLEGDVNIDGRKFARIIAQAVWDEFVRMGRLKPQKI